MGLGKTIEALSLIHANKPPLEQHNDKSTIKTAKSPTTLIVCPMSLLAQWRDEIIRGSKEDTISVTVYYGNDRSLDLQQSLCRWDGNAPDVLLTTYGVVMTEWNGIQTGKSSGFNLFQVEFWRVMLDEAHQIKNHTSKTSQACQDINARRRWAITGTPIQNKLDDLFALVKYLRHQPWSNHTFWNSFITVPFKNQDKNALKTVQTVLEPLVLRRTKQMKDKQGNPMVPLPPKYINIEYLSFTPEEQDIYDAFYNDSKTKFSYYVNAGQAGSNYANILQLLTRLRQICCHPYLAIKQNHNTGNVLPSLENLIADYDTRSREEKNGNSYGLSVLQSMLSKQQSSQSSSQDVVAEGANETVKMDSVDIPDECPICFEPIDVIIAMPCMHMACRLCVLEYFQVKKNKRMGCRKNN
jgi:DNA repair protein RAD5